MNSPDELYDLVNRRIKHLFKRKYTTDDINFEDIFTHSVSNINPFEYIVDRTLMRPRDIISFINECLAKAEGQYEVTSAMVKSAEGEYSRIRKNALEQEWQSAFPSLPMFLPLLASKKSGIQFDEFRDSINDDLALELGTNSKYSLAAIMHHARVFLRVRRVDARQRSVRRDRREDTRCATRLGLICHVGGLSGRTAPRPMGLTA